jgi:hypothetical protein
LCSAVLQNANRHEYVHSKLGHRWSVLFDRDPISDNDHSFEWVGFREPGVQGLYG